MILFRVSVMVLPSAAQWKVLYTVFLLIAIYFASILAISWFNFWLFVVKSINKTVKGKHDGFNTYGQQDQGRAKTAQFDIGNIIGADRNIQKLPLGNRGWTQGPCIEYTF